MRTFISALFIFSSLLFAQDVNKVVIDEKSEKPMLVGLTTLEAFQDTSFSWWWNSEYELYEINEDALAYLDGKMEEIQILIVMGTWCSDSRREVPRFFKILDELNFPVDDVMIINVDRKMEDPENLSNGLDIMYVPTFIFYKNDTETGRIIETPETSLEEDMVGIVDKS
jgi:thiol-disulfide isomerase/thioredoxin